MNSKMNRVEMLRSILISRGYWNAIEAMEFAARFHTGTRRNGDHEFSHPVEVALQLLESDIYIELPEETIITALLHDLSEDYDIGFDTISLRFGYIVEKALRSVTKTYRGTTFSFDVKMTEAAHCPIGSLVKSSDRLHNIKTMKGAFTHEKALDYIAETENQIEPAMELSMRLHPHQSLSVSFFLSKIRSAKIAYLGQNQSPLPAQ